MRKKNLLIKKYLKIDLIKRKFFYIIYFWVIRNFIGFDFFLNI